MNLRCVYAKEPVVATLTGLRFCTTQHAQDLATLSMQNPSNVVPHSLQPCQHEASCKHLPPCRISYLAYIKVFVGLAKDRLNGLMASPSATSAAHIRALALLAWMVTDNATWVMLHFAAFPHSDITYRLLWLFDAVVISVEALQTASIYGMLVSCHEESCLCVCLSLLPALRWPTGACSVSVLLHELFLCSSSCTFVQRFVCHLYPLLYAPMCLHKSACILSFGQKASCTVRLTTILMPCLLKLFPVRQL